MPVDGADTVAEIVRIGGDGFPPDADVYVDHTESFKSAEVVVSRESSWDGALVLRGGRG